MQIEKPRTQAATGRGNRVVHKMGPSQYLMTQLIGILAAGEAPPKGLLTATGMLREHVANDLQPLGFVDIKRLDRGHSAYRLAKDGRDVLAGRVEVSPLRTLKQKRQYAELQEAISLLARQRGIRMRRVQVPYQRRVA